MRQGISYAVGNHTLDFSCEADVLLNEETVLPVFKAMMAQDQSGIQFGGQAMKITQGAELALASLSMREIVGHIVAGRVVMTPVH